MRRPWLPAAAWFSLALIPAAVRADTSGQEVFNRQCAQCHAPGIEHPGTRQLTLTRGEDKGVLTERDDLVEEYVRYVVRNGMQAMPGFYPSDLTEAQLDALAAFLAGQ